MEGEVGIQGVRGDVDLEGGRVIGEMVRWRKDRRIKGGRTDEWLSGRARSQDKPDK